MTVIVKGSNMFKAARVAVISCTAAVLGLAGTAAVYAAASDPAPPTPMQDSFKQKGIDDSRAAMDAAPKASKAGEYTPPNPSDDAAYVQSVPTELVDGQDFSWPGNPINIKNAYSSTIDGHGVRVLVGSDKGTSTRGIIMLVVDPGSPGQQVTWIDGPTSEGPIAIDSFDATSQTIVIRGKSGKPYRFNVKAKKFD